MLGSSQANKSPHSRITNPKRVEVLIIFLYIASRIFNFWMLFDNCGRKFALPSCMDSLTTYTSQITVRTATSPKKDWVWHVERIEKIRNS